MTHDHAYTNEKIEFRTDGVYQGMNTHNRCKAWGQKYTNFTIPHPKIII
jgi:hypothetical protein